MNHFGPSRPTSPYITIYDPSSMENCPIFSIWLFSRPIHNISLLDLTYIGPFNILKILLPPFTLHHRRSLPLKTYKRLLFLSIEWIGYLLSPWIWKKPRLLSRHTWFLFINTLMRWPPWPTKPTKHVCSTERTLYSASWYCLPHNTWLKMIEVLPSTTYKMRINLW